jgi:ATP synthase protein I
MEGPAMTGSSAQDDFIHRVQRQLARLKRARDEGEPSFSRQLAQIGVLGWIIITPALVGLFGGRWLDRHFASGVFWSATLLFAGVSLGFWSAWRWMHTP